MKRQLVKSSLIHSLAYNIETQTLELQFLTKGAPGNIYTYQNFPLEKWTEFTESPSLGKYFLANIKKQFTGKKVEPPAPAQE